jgi:ubiquinone/menaquinone biosynthesis C-methylase UbiE
MNNLQKEAFIEFEANKWFERNIQAINNFNSSDDIVCQVIKKYSLNPNVVLEIGSSSGHRLYGLSEILGDTVQYFGIDPSQNAINFGNKKYKNINLAFGTADNLSHFENDSIDLIIVGFVFYVVDRNLLLRAISEIDRVLSENGSLIIVDFFSEIPKKNNYHHIKDFDVFSYKQNYHEIFLSTKMYNLIDFKTQSHSLNPSSPNLLDYNELYTCSLLKKNINEGYK